MAPQTSWRELGWNRVRFSVPSHWEVGRLGNAYLLLEDQVGPVCEVKWAKVKGTFSHERTLQRLMGSGDKGRGQRVTGSSVPPEWEKALCAYRISGFLWNKGRFGGMGVIAHCPGCSNVTLIQFYETEGRKVAKGVAPRVLATFKDHCPDGRVLWSLFDIRAVVPDRFTLTRYRFETGTFTLSFAHNAEGITLWRWGPASVLLGEKDLAALGQRLWQGCPGFSQNREKDQTVEYASAPSPGFWSRMWALARRNPAFRWIRLWHLPEKNRIMGVEAEGKHPLNRKMLEGICTHYESL